MKTLGIIQRKGGNGKSTAALNLAAAFGEQGKRVLLVDTDEQKNTTSTIPIQRSHCKTIESLLLEEQAWVQDIAEPTTWAGVDLLAGSLGLSSVVSVMEDLYDGHLLLRDKLKAAYAWDLCIIDTSPSLTMLTINAMCASQGIFIPLASSYYSLEGLAQTLEAYRKVRVDLHHTHLKLYGAAFVIHDGRTRLAAEVQEKVREQYSDLLCDTVIGRNIKIEEAQVARQSILSYAPGDRGAAQYRSLAKELAARMGL
jgi:chromosome partitioning protein